MGPRFWEKIGGTWNFQCPTLISRLWQADPQWPSEVQAGSGISNLCEWSDRFRKAQLVDWCTCLCVP